MARQLPAAPMSGGCADCGGRRYIKTSQGPKRCGCFWATLTEDIKPIIRHGEPSLPAAFAELAPWPLTSKTVTSGDYHLFRHTVWRSLLYHMAEDEVFHFQTKYDYMEAGRLGEIYFRQDEEYPSYRGLLHPGLLVVVCGVADAPNKLLPHLVRAVTALREMHGKPTWIYAANMSALALTPLAPAERPIFAPTSVERPAQVERGKATSIAMRAAIHGFPRRG
jgi:hypothetical protein